VFAFAANMDPSGVKHRLAAGFDPALSEQLLYIADAQREAEIQPHRITDHLWRKPMALE
jgi:hypothetical protein